MPRKLEVPTDLRRGKRDRREEEEWRASAHALLKLTSRAFGLDDLSGTALLDVGCGTRFASAIVNDDIALRRYVGVDTDARIVDFLAANVHDPRLSFHLLDAHNEMYNPEGRPLASFDRLPVGDEPFDVVVLFSVFTHLAPPDFRAMLELLRPHVAPDGGLLFSLFVDEGMSPEQREALNAEIRRRRAAGDPEIEAAIRRSEGQPEVPDFVDRIPDHPLMEAVYSERHARELIEGTGWEVEALHRPIPPIIQHHFVCRPV